MNILAIETSCDETAVCLLKAEGDLADPKFEILGNTLLSQIDIHRPYGGVFPSLAKREHAKNLIPLLTETLSQAGRLTAPNHPQTLKPELEAELINIFSHEPVLGEQLQHFITTHQQPKNLDAIAVTVGPGLEPALWTGINLAKALHLIWDLPIIPVNHMAGHIASVWLAQTEALPISDSQFSNQIKWPAVALLVSGGHTELVLIKKWGDFQIIGQTRDDAAGEAFDKVARLLDLPYPGGPEISRLADQARVNNRTFESAFPNTQTKLPRPMLGSNDLDFSFSGLKTAVMYLLRDLNQLSTRQQAALAREFEDAVIEVLTQKTKQAALAHSPYSLMASGGVIANPFLRRALSDLGQDLSRPVLIPPLQFSTDNAVMIAAAGYLNHLQNPTPAEADKLRADGGLELA